jgi:hypothetical protein
LWKPAAKRRSPPTIHDDLTFEQAHTIVFGILRKDVERHQYWVWVMAFLFS